MPPPDRGFVPLWHRCTHCTAASLSLCNGTPSPSCSGRSPHATANTHAEITIPSTPLVRYNSTLERGMVMCVFEGHPKQPPKIWTVMHTIRTTAVVGDPLLRTLQLNNQSMAHPSGPQGFDNIFSPQMLDNITRDPGLCCCQRCNVRISTIAQHMTQLKFWGTTEIIIDIITS